MGTDEHNEVLCLNVQLLFLFAPVQGNKKVSGPEGTSFCPDYFRMAARMVLTIAARSSSGSRVRNFSNLAMALALSALFR